MYRHRIGCHKRYKPMTTIELKKLSRGRWTDSDCPTISLIMASYLLNFYNKNVFVFKNYQNTVKISKMRRFLTQMRQLILLKSKQTRKYETRHEPTVVGNRHQ